jgi:hypothetical protein
MKKSVFIFLVCLVLQAVLIGKAVAYGEAVSQLEGNIAELMGENQELELRIASQISCSAIAQKTAQANLTPLTQVEPKDGHSVALKR